MSHFSNCKVCKRKIQNYVNNCWKDNLKELSDKDKKFYQEAFPQDLLAGYLNKQVEGFTNLYNRLCKDKLIFPNAVGLDIGCGYGTPSLVFKNNKIDMVGIELEHAFTKFAKGFATYFSLNCEFVTGNANNLPFSQETFDFVLSIAAFEHDPSPQKTFEQIYSALKPGGSLYLSTPNKFDIRALYGKSDKDSSLKFRVLNLLKRIRGIHKFPYVYQLGTAGGVRRMLGSAGFREIESKKFSCFQKKGYFLTILDWFYGDLKLIAIK